MAKQETGNNKLAGQAAPFSGVTGSLARGVSRGAVLTRVLPHLVALVAFSVVSAAATWPLLPRLGGFVVNKLDPLFSVWSLGWQAHALGTNPGGLFDTNVMYPFKGTLAFDELSFAEAVIGAPLYWLSGNPVLSHNAVLLLTFLISGYAMWLLVRELTGSSAVAYIAGSAFAFSFYRMDHLPHLTLLSVEWIPLILLAAYKLLWTGQWRWAAALGAFFAVQALSSHYLAFFSAILLGLFFVYYGIAERRKVSASMFGKLALVMGASLAVILPVLIPYVSTQAGQNFSRDLFQVERYSNTLASFLAVYEGNPLYKTLLAPFADPGPWPWERAAFPGITVLILSGAAVWLVFRGRRDNTGDSSPGGLRKHVGFFLLVTLLAAFLSLGPTLQLTYSPSSYDPTAVNGIFPLPYILLHEWVPGFQSMRGAARIIVLMSLGLSVLAGMGMHYLLGSLSTRPKFKALPGAVLPVVIGVVALLPVIESWSAPLYLEPIETRQAVPEVYRWLGAQPRTVVAEYPMVYYKPGLGRVELANRYQYFSLYHFQNLVNGSATIRPYAYTALVHETEDCFPCPRSLDALWALGVEYVVVHLPDLSDPQRTDFIWRTTHAEGGVLDDFTLVKDFGSDRVYQIRSQRPVSELSALIPRGGTLLLADPSGDPIKVGNSASFIGGGYIAALAYYLRDHPEYGDNRLGFGQPILEPPTSIAPDFALLWSRQDPGSVGYLDANRIWSNGIVTLYKRGPGRAAMGWRNR